MPQIPAVKAIYKEWKIVIRALEQYQKQLDAEMEVSNDSGRQSDIYEDLEMLERLIPSIKSQLHEFHETPPSK